MAKKISRKANKKSSFGLFRKFLLHLINIGVWIFIGFSGILAFYSYDLPNVDKLVIKTRSPTITFKAKDRSHLLTLGEIYGEPVSVHEIAPSLKQAVLAIEDRRFYSHFGVDLIGLMRATYANMREGRIIQGGSTLTQQLAKNLFLSPKKTFKRKAQELILALWLENKFSKDQIFTIYLNRAYLGSGIYGVEAASKKYFNKSSRNLTIYESAMLAGLLKAPSRLNPAHNPILAKKRANQVLSSMVSAGYLSESSKKNVKKKIIHVKSKASHKIRYFTDWILPQVSGYITLGDTDIVVITTLDRNLQLFAEKEISKILKHGEEFNVSQGAIVAMSPNGAVRSMVGGGNYSISQFNRATQAKRQPGSAFKPIVFAAGIERGLKPDSEFTDEPIIVENWSPRNFSRKYLGKVTMSQALAKSINTVAVRISELVGRQNVVNVAKRLGISSKLLPTPSIALGVNGLSLIELTAAYGVFANGGFGVWPHGIEEIQDGERRVLYRREGSGPSRVIEFTVVSAINKMLKEALREGIDSMKNFSRPLAGKTGTSQKNRDAWFIGYSSDLIAGVWLGNDDQMPMRDITGGSLPAIAWKRFMIAAHQEIPIRPLLSEAD